MTLPPAPKPDGPTVWARFVSLFVDYAVRRGVSRAALLAAGRMSELALADPDGRVALVSLYAIVEAIVAQTGDASFGLELVLGVEVEALDALGFLFMTSDTFGQGVERMLRYQRLWNEGERCELESDGTTARLTYEPYGPSRPAHVQMAQVAMFDCVVNGPRFVPGLQFEQVRFRHARPADASTYERVLGVPVHFGCAGTEARFSGRMLSLPIPDANAQLCAFFERYTSAKVERLLPMTSTAQRLRAAIRAQLPDGEVTLPELAQRLHLSARTLQRRLSDEGTSLQSELDEVRRQQALYFLEGGTAIAELSWLLGYAEPSAFHRAFKRWTGTSPEAWRAERRSA